jgi:hypothetical protein
MMALLAPALLLLLLVSSAAGEQSAATLQVSNTLASNMVLQRGRPAPIWGWHSAGAKVAVAFDGATHSATAGADGLWKVALPAQEASLVSKTIEISSGGEHVTLGNVLFGDVILCSAPLPARLAVASAVSHVSAACRLWIAALTVRCAWRPWRCPVPGGQSNMEFVLSSAVNATAEIAAADAYPHIRVVDGPQQNTDRLPLTPPANASMPHTELFYNRMNWSVASSETVGKGSVRSHTKFPWFRRVFSVRIAELYQGQALRSRHAAAETDFRTH